MVNALNAIPPWVAFLLMIAGLVVLLRPERDPRPEYIAAFDAFKYVWKWSAWGKEHPNIPAGDASREFQRGLTTGRIAATGVHSYSNVREPIPQLHWHVACLDHKKLAEMPCIRLQADSTTLPIDRLSTVHFAPGAAGGVTYADVEIRWQDVVRRWPRERKWWA